MGAAFLSAWHRASDKIRIFLELSKSGIVTLVAISVTAGYLAGQSLEAPFHFSHFLWVLTSIYLLASGSSALNQVQEREIDQKMNRTARRPIPSGRISTQEALLLSIFCILLGTLGLSLVGTEILLWGLLAVVSYNGFYTFWWKKHWAFGAIPGAIPGALPILMGFGASSGTALRPLGLYLFAVLFYWQMPHFWSLAIKYEEDYRQGGIPTLPVRIGSKKTKEQIVLWCLGYCGLALLAPLFASVSWIYVISAALVCLKILWELHTFYKNPEEKGWLRFFLWINFSLIILLGALVLDLWSVYLFIPFLT